jgi:molybdopterin-containing oxidoreductase family iron-sulfur binding subunit
MTGANVQGVMPTNTGDIVYWKTLGELREESRSPSEVGSTNRRDFLALMGFTVGAAACSRAPVHKAIPFLNQPEDLTPGVPMWYATTCGGCSACCSVLVKTRDGRPIKIEGNPEAPLFGGGTCAVGQATVLSLYDNERLKGPLWHGRSVSWDDTDARIDARLQAAVVDHRAVVLLTGTITGPATRDLIERWSRRYDGFRHVVYDAVSFTAIRRAYDRFLGRAIVPHFRMDRARAVVGLDADFLGSWLSPVEFTRQYSSARRPSAGMMRHVQFESGLSLTGANADVRHSVAPEDIDIIAVALLSLVREPARAHEQFAGDHLPVPLPILEDLAADLRRHRGECVIVCGASDVATQVIVAALNHELGAIGRAINVDRPSLQKLAHDTDVAALVADMRRGDVGALLIHGVNPAYDYDDAASFLEGVKNVELVVSFADRLDETAALAHAVCPDHHFLESWGDAEPVAATYGLSQPAMAPLFETRAVQDSLLKWLGESPDFHAYLRAYWKSHIFPRQQAEPDFDRFWDRTLQAGFIELPVEPGTWNQEPPAVDVAGAAETIRSRHAQPNSRADDSRFSLHLYESVVLRDGRHANNPWLQELPDPITKITWGHTVAIAPPVAQRLGLADGDVVRVRSARGAVELPASVQPGQCPTTVSIALGYGRRRAGRVGNDVGVNVFPLTPIDGDGVRHLFAAGVELEKTGRRMPPAATQTHHSMEGRPLVREMALATFLENVDGQEIHDGEPSDHRSLWAEHPAGQHRWGMTIDLGACTGCSACVVACQAENNVAVVGADEVRRGREMHWIRIDRYYTGSPSAPGTVFQPVMCQHCANAPCETVCPVLATVHSSDGINQQIYNRCIGTRYCENNCPYKVRRFNWFTYANNPRFDFTMMNPVERMVLNPDVVVRSRGVMEKCSLCVQRIQAGQLAAKLGARPLADGDIRTACQQVCPAEAIVFGDLQDPESRVARLARSSRHYRLLESIGTQPGVGYQTKVRNRES